MGENEYEINNYYTASQVAEILGLDKRTIIYRCTKSWYSGAFKTVPPITSKENGQWLIPKRCIDVATEIKDVATLTRQINPAELERTIMVAITNSITHAIEPLHKKIDEQNQKLIDQASKIDQLQRQNDDTTKIIGDINTKTNTISEDTKTIITNTRLEKNSSNSNYGEIFIVGIVVILFITIILNFTRIINIAKIFKAA